MNYVKSGLCCWTRFQSWNNSRKRFDHLQFSGILSVKCGWSLKLEVLDRGLHEVQDGGDVSAIQAEVPAGKTKFNVSCQIKFGHFTFQTWLKVSITSLQPLSSSSLGTWWAWWRWWRRWSPPPPRPCSPRSAGTATASDSLLQKYDI